MDFVKQLIAEKLNFPLDQLQIIAAHRSLSKKPETAGAPPRSIIVRFLQWNTQQQVLRAAWTQREIQLDGTRIYFDRDFSVKVQRQRAQYVPIRRQLREKKIKSHIIFPAKLKVFGEGEPAIYNTPEEACVGLRELGLVTDTPLATTPQRRGEYTHGGDELLERLKARAHIGRD